MAITAEELRSLDGFRSLPHTAASALVATSRTLTFAPDETLFHEGDESRGIFIVLGGEVRVVRSSRGRRHVFHTERRGGMLGEAPFFDHAPYPATAVAFTAVMALYLDRGTLDRAMRTDPEIAHFFLSRLAGRVRLLLDRIDRLATANVEKRLAAYLLERAASSGNTTIEMTQASLAEELGTVREVVMRSVRALRTRGLIRADGRGRTTILNADALRALVSEGD